MNDTGVCLPDAVSDIESESDDENRIYGLEAEIATDSSSADEPDSDTDSDEGPKASAKSKKEQWHPKWRANRELTVGDIGWKSEIPALPADQNNPKKPIQYFKLMFTDEMIENIVTETNRYSTSEKGASINTNTNEIRLLLGIFLKLMVIQPKRYRLCWAGPTKLPFIADLMPRNRFELLKRFLHFNDNNNAPAPNDPNRDRLYKVRPLIDAFAANCRNIPPEEKHSVDEQLIPFKGRSKMKQYLPKKPKKWGFKIFARCGVSGILYDFYFFDGNAPQPSVSTGKIPGDWVMLLCDTLPPDQNFKVYFDNYFNWPIVGAKLKERGIYSIGTLQACRVKDCQLKEDKALKKEGRGSFDSKVDIASELAVVRWFDNRGVTLSSTYVATEPVQTVRRYDRQKKEFINVQRPAIVKEYNLHMGGVDLADMLAALYRMSHRSVRWYIRLFFWVLGSSITNAWLLYRRDCQALDVPKKEQMDLLDFISDVGDSLCHYVPPPVNADDETPRRGRPSTSAQRVVPTVVRRVAAVPAPALDARFDGYEHWPCKVDRGMCRQCHDKNVRPRIGCSKCGVPLCVAPNRNCFQVYHTRVA